MSRGLGRIGQAIAANIDYVSKRTGRPDPVHISSRDLLRDVYDPKGLSDGTFTAAERKAVVRAMHGFVRRHPQYALAGGKGRNLLVLYDLADPASRKAVSRVTEHAESTSRKVPVEGPFKRGF